MPNKREPFTYPRDPEGFALCHHGRRIACDECVSEEEVDAEKEAKGKAVRAPSGVRPVVGGDIVCKHGVAMDVHCCNCHSGFIFDRDHECIPADTGEAPTEPTTAERNALNWLESNPDVPYESAGESALDVQHHNDGYGIVEELLTEIRRLRADTGEATPAPLHKLRRIIEDFKNGTQVQSVKRDGPGKHRRAAERREVETIHKTLNVVLAEIDKLLSGDRLEAIERDYPDEAQWKAVHELIAEVRRLRAETERLKQSIEDFNRNDHDERGAAETWHDCYLEQKARAEQAEAARAALEGTVRALKAEHDRIWPLVEHVIQPDDQVPLETAVKLAVEQARAALIPYVQHKDDCELTTHPSGYIDRDTAEERQTACSCGLIDHLKETQ